MSESSDRQERAPAAEDARDAARDADERLSEEVLEPSAADGEAEREEEPRPDYLEDLKRVQAEFENFRKRVIKEQTQLVERASARLIERLLPSIDHFRAAIDHGEGGAGVRLAIKELMEVLQAEGLEEIDAVGKPFDPTLHEAVATYDDTEVSVETVAQVQRNGYTFKGKILRAPYVVVARPAAPDAGDG